MAPLRMFRNGNLALTTCFVQMSKSFLARNQTLEWFGGLHEFKKYHEFDNFTKAFVITSRKFKPSESLKLSGS